MNHDGSINIATGLSGGSRVWKNKTWQFSDFVKRLQQVQVTSETHREFIAATLPEQGKIKDVGGYVGAYLRNGRRTKATVVHRQLLTLDIDFAHIDFWQDFVLTFDCAAILHSTHKHCEASPRYRLLIPLNREVTPDEYSAISRRVAGDLGIDLFDQTTFDINRLMFWPSVPKDVEYYFRQQDGPWLDADAVLAQYIDWRDTSLWPTSGKALRDLDETIGKQENPTEKKGIIGAFCRTFTIQEVIEKFLSAEYVDAGDGRYTYTKGSTAAGLIVYEDKFAYSHHGTDPASGKLCNAFDLVRLHLYGHLDNHREDIAPSKTKSYAAMQDLAKSDPEVRKLNAKESLEQARYDFADGSDLETDAAFIESTTNWMAELETDTKGGYLSSATNINTILANDPRLRGLFRQNNFDGKRYVTATLPWRRVDKPEPVKNVDYAGLRNYIESIYGITGNLKIDDSLALEFDKRSFHPVVEYLESITWDGTERVDSLLIDYFGADDNIYSREAIRKTLCGAVARVYHPGCKFDTVLTLVGPQGTNKSTLVKKLGKDWHSDTFTTVNGKEAFEQVQGAWLIEMAELAATRKAEMEAVKHFISKQVDTFRPAYGRVSETYPRQCVFIATTNMLEFLRDPTGNRRFIPVLVQPSNIKKDVWTDLDADIDQIWAEAVHLYEEGERLYLSTEAEAIANRKRAEHSELDERKGIVEDYLSRLLPKDWHKLDIFERRIFIENGTEGTVERDHVCIAEIWCELLGKNKEDMSRYNTRDINEIMKGLGDWTASNSTKNFAIYGKQKYYSRKIDLL